MFEAYADPAKRRETVTEIDTDRQMTRLGPGALHDVGLLASLLGIRRALVLVDPHLEHSSGMQVLKNKLQAEGIAWELCDHVTPTAIDSNVYDAVEALKAGNCDGVITFGGGSAHDIGKCTALIGKHGGTILDYAHEHKVVDSTLPHIAINTTAGTSAEMSSCAFVTTEHGHEHTILHHDILVPEAAILDPLTHLSMPSHVTAATGINALSDAIEAYVSRAHTPETDKAALEAIQIIAENLPKAFKDGDDLEARTAMARGAYLAGTAFNGAGLGIVDSISLVVSSLFNIGHSTANAIVLPHVMAYDAFSVDDRMGDIARAMGRDVTGMDRKHMAEAAIDAVVDLKNSMGLTENLADRGMGWDDLYLCAHAILRHPFIKRNPRDLDEAGLTEILLGAMETKRIIVDEPPAELQA